MKTVWPARFDEALPLRIRPAFHLYAARSVADGSRCVVLLPGSDARPEAIERAFDKIEAAHARLSSARIPPVRARGVEGATPWLEFGCDAVLDGIELLRLVAEADLRLPYGQSDALISGVRDALAAAHAVTDPAGEGPLCIGSLSYGNLLIARDGRMFVVGFGHNFPIEKDSGLPDGHTVCFHAAEIAAGAPRTPQSDYIAVLLLARSLMQYAELGPMIAAVLRGDTDERHVELVEHMQWFEQRMISELPARRPSVQDALARSQRVRELLGVPLDPEGLAATLRGLIESHGEASEVQQSAAVVTAPPVLQMAADGSWIGAPDGSKLKLGRALRRILLLLVERQQRAPAETVTLSEVLEAGWPGERPIGQSGANRVYVTVSRLRRMGLGDLLERFDGGYRLRAGVKIERLEP